MAVLKLGTIRFSKIQFAKFLFPERVLQITEISIFRKEVFNVAPARQLLANQRHFDFQRGSFKVKKFLFPGRKL
jgi:hypothetical protein